MERIISSPYLWGICIGIATLFVSYLKFGPAGFKKIYEPAFGEKQIFCPIGYPGTTLLKYAKMPKEGSTVRFISYNFPKNEWGKETPLYNWVEKQLERGIEIEVYGGPEVESKDELKELQSKGLVIHILTDYQTEHYVTFSNPKQIWAEEFHDRDTAKNCFYTDKPLDYIWDQIYNHFDKKLPINRSASI